MKADKKQYTGWDRDEQGNLAPPALLTHCGDGALEAEIIVGMLNSFGISAVTELPGDGDFGKLIIGRSGYGVDIFVPATRLEQARELLRADAVDDEFDPDEESNPEINSVMEDKSL